MPDELDVDMKLTRNEIIDLIVEEMEEEITIKLDACMSIINSLDEKIEKFGDDWAVGEITGKPKTTFDSNLYGDNKDMVLVKSVWFVPKSKAPPELKQLKKDREAASLQRDNLQTERRKLTENKGKARIQVIRNHLQSTFGGQKILDSIERVKGAMKKKLLGGGT